MSWQDCWQFLSSSCDVVNHRVLMSVSIMGENSVHGMYNHRTVRKFLSNCPTVDHCAAAQSGFSLQFSKSASVYTKVFNLWFGSEHKKSKLKLAAKHYILCEQSFFLSLHSKSDHEWSGSSTQYSCTSWMRSGKSWSTVQHHDMFITYTLYNDS